MSKFISNHFNKDHNLDLFAQITNPIASATVYQHVLSIHNNTVAPPVILIFMVTYATIVIHKEWESGNC